MQLFEELVDLSADAGRDHAKLIGDALDRGHAGMAGSSSRAESAGVGDQSSRKTFALPLPDQEGPAHRPRTLTNGSHHSHQNLT
jgi:hypothetical protein